MVLVFPLHASGTHADLVGAAVQLQQGVVKPAQVVLQVHRGRDQPVAALPHVVDPQVARAEGADALRAGLDRRGDLPPAHAALHLRRSAPGAGLQELLHHLSEDRVPAQQRFGLERLPALRAAVLALRLTPHVLDAAQAVAVSAGDGHRLPQDLQAHRAAELVVLDRDRRGRHCERKLKRSVGWAGPTGATWKENVAPPSQSGQSQARRSSTRGRIREGGKKVKIEIKKDLKFKIK